MRVLVNSYNTTSPGTINVTSSLIAEMNNCAFNKYTFILPKITNFDNIAMCNNDVTLVLVNTYLGAFKYIYRMIYEIILYPILIVRYKPDIVLALGNYALYPFKKKVIFLQHSFLVDDDSFSSLRLYGKIIETFRRLTFKISLFNCVGVIVQSEAIKNLFNNKYSLNNIPVNVLTNPRKSIKLHGVPKDINSICYISRCYPHKNHKFLIELVDKYQSALRQIEFKLYVTVDSTSDKYCKCIIQDIARRRINDLIVNLGEMDKDEISIIYEKCKALIFPSFAESFGIPILEAMQLGLPVIVPDLPYARSICEEAGYYYNHDSIDCAFNAVYDILCNTVNSIKYSKMSLCRSNKFHTQEEWATKLDYLITSMY